MPPADRILVIDDSPLIRNLIDDTLTAAGFLVSQASGGEEGMALAAEVSPVAVLCDLSMPGVSGLDVVRQLKLTQPNTPIIMFTESMQLADAVDAMKLGAFGYVSKGTAEHTLINELRKAIDHRRVVERNLQLEEEARDHQLERERQRLHDVEERQRELETLLETKTRQISQLARARAHEERLAAMGSIVAGIAHEVNNPLAVLKAGARFLAENTPALLAQADPDTAADLVATIAEVEECAQRIQKIIENVRKLTPAPTGPSTCNPDLALQEAMHLCRDKIPPRVHVDFDVDPTADRVGISQDDLALITSNLLLNAAQSYGVGATKGSVVVRVRPGEGYVTMDVEDTGCGISDENLPQVCNPFFTTRPPGEGIGLGLALVHQMVKNAAGTLRIESAVGKGTRVQLRIPAEASLKAFRSPAARS